TSGPRRLVAVRFRPGGAAAFLGGAVGALTDTGAELGDLWRDAEAFTEAVAGAADPVSAVQRALVGRERRAVDRRLVHAIDHLWAGRRVAEVAREVGWSRQHLTRRLTPVVGYGPALLARVGRLSRIVADARRGAPCWTELAHTHGFADSAHLTHDFEDLVGLVPSAWRP
ncbi:MAG: helix-turn-helix transcriptional regulator, partial [Myxococcales bacterium]|nr:helix-turn-helix transcriptional regulator [Myxococcales bacterium]